MAKYSIEAFPEKAQFGPAETAAICVRLNDALIQGGRVRLTAWHLGNVVETQEQDAAEKLRFFLRAERRTEFLEGYLVKVELLCGGKEIAAAFTAFDRAADWRYAPRYGFLSDFSAEDENDTEDVEIMDRLHLNVIQFYDWMYRHDDFFPKSDPFRDIMGKKSSMKTVGKKITALHSHGMKAIAYGAVYGAESYFEEHPDCALCNARLEPMVFIDRIHLMDIHRGGAWHNHILGEYRKAVAFGFDGIHMDQYGFPKEAYARKNGSFVLRHLRDDFVDLIDDAKSALPQTGIIFNAVNDWPTDAAAKAGEDCVYIEVWPPNDTYGDLNRLIRDAKKFAPQKQVILAAYLQPFAELTPNSDGGCTAQLAMASVFSSGGFHLLLGEDGGLLTQAYYSDYFQVANEGLKTALQNYYDFITAYGDILFGFGWIDETRICTGGINKEFVLSGGEFSVEPKSGHVWTQIRRNGERCLIQLVNFMGVTNMNWNEIHPNFPDEVCNVSVTVHTPEPVTGIFSASPDDDHGMCKKLDFTRTFSADGNAEIRFTIPKLRVWSAVWLEYGNCENNRQ